MIRIILPGPLQTIARVGPEIELKIEGTPTQRNVIDALETTYPSLRGTLRDAIKDRRRPRIRFYACEQDLSHTEPDDPLPAAVADGRQPYIIIGAISGG